LLGQDVDVTERQAKYKKLLPIPLFLAFVFGMLQWGHGVTAVESDP
jgi:hypothetical protein